MARQTTSKRVSAVAGIVAASFTVVALPSYADQPSHNKPYVDQSAHLEDMPGGNLETQDGRCVSGGDGALVNCGMPGFALFVAQQLEPGKYQFRATVNNKDVCLSGRDNVVQPCDNSNDQQWLATKPAGGDPGQPPWGLKAVGVQGDHECLVINGNKATTGPTTGTGDDQTCPAQWK